MSTQITTAMVEQYKSNVLMLAQQKGSKLRDTVRSEDVTGKNAYFERIGAVDMVDSTSRHDDTPQIDTPHCKFTPDGELFSFLDSYAMAGGSHHLAISPGNHRGRVAKLASILGIPFVSV